MNLQNQQQQFILQAAFKHPKEVCPNQRAKFSVQGKTLDRKQRQVSVQAANEFELDREMRAAEKRWESNVKEGRVKNVTCKEAGQMIEDGWTLVDVRPPNESEKAQAQDSVIVPLFVEDPSNDINTLLKKATAFGMGGWWLGGSYYIPNKQFIQQVQEKVPKDAKLIVACQKGLRSLAACEQLFKAGYRSIAWINGGFDTFKEGDIVCKDNVNLKFGGIGGISEALGWTEVQQAKNENAFSQNTILKVAGVVLFLDALWFGYEQLQYMRAGK